jgi:hypothetical protein
MAYSFVNSPASVSLFVDSFKDLPADPPSLYVDLEEEKLCREGSISLESLFVHLSAFGHLLIVLGAPGIQHFGMWHPPTEKCV